MLSACAQVSAVILCQIMWATLEYTDYQGVLIMLLTNMWHIHL